MPVITQQSLASGSTSFWAPLGSGGGGTVPANLVVSSLTANGPGSYVSTINLFLNEAIIFPKDFGAPGSTLTIVPNTFIVGGGQDSGLIITAPCIFSCPDGDAGPGRIYISDGITNNEHAITATPSTTIISDALTTPLVSTGSLIVSSINGVLTFTQAQYNALSTLAG